MSLSPPSSPQSRGKATAGLFRDGVWLCNCEPRQNAKILTVTKRTENYRKRFYGCPKGRTGNSCDLFLLLEHAKLREQDNLMTNGRSEMRQTTLHETMAAAAARNNRSTQQRRSKAGRSSTQPVPGDRDRQDVSASAAPTAIPHRSVTPIMAGPSTRRSNRLAAGSAISSTQRDGDGNGKLPRPPGFWDTTSNDEDTEEEAVSSHATTRAKSGYARNAVQPIAASQPPPRTTRATRNTRGKRASRDEDSEDEGYDNKKKGNNSHSHSNERYEQDLLDDLSSSDEMEMIAVTEESVRTTNGRHRDALRTPNTAVRTTDMENGLVTPPLTKNKSLKKVLFKDSVEDIGGTSMTSPKRQRREDGSASGSSSMNTIASTHALGRSSSSSSNPPSDDTSTPARRLFGSDDVIPPRGAPSARSPHPSRAPSSSVPLPPTTTTSSTTNNNNNNNNSSPNSTPNPPIDPSTLTSEVTELLKDAPLSPEVRGQLRWVLEKHANQALGYERGRDAARTSARDAHDRCAKLQARIDDLERSRQETRTQLMEVWRNA